MTSRRVAGIAVFVLACWGDTKDSGSVGPLSKTEYLEQYPTAFCELLERCSADEFNHIYDSDLENCVGEITTWARDRLNRRCAYDGDAAGTCVALMPDADCEAWNAGDYSESCGEIIDC